MTTENKKPIISVGILALIVLCCALAGVISNKDPAFLDIYNTNCPPNSEFLFGTDSLGRDIFTAIWYGGRISIAIGLLSAAISTVIAVIYGSLSGIANEWVDSIMMRFAEIMLSIPSLLLVLLVQAALGKANVISLSIVIGITSWPAIAKVVRTDVRQIRNSEYVIASRCMGGGFFHILRQHLLPNFLGSIMFMVVMNIRSAIVWESTLSFMGMGLPLDIISWGSMLSLAQGAILGYAWWVVVIPGIFLVLLIMSITNIGNYIRQRYSPEKELI